MDAQRLELLSSSNSTLHPVELALPRQEITAPKVEIKKSKIEPEAPQPQRRLREALISHFRRPAIPPEILGEIFTHTLASSLPQAEQLTTICLVCRGWRRVALGTPQLWTDLAIEADGFIDVKKVEAWLSRSGTFAKKVSIDLFYALDHTYCPLATLELAGLLSEGHVLESLSLECKHPECFRDLFALIPTVRTRGFRAWDQLKSLHLECLGNRWDNLEPNVFQLLPQLLETLSLKLPNPAYNWPNPPLPRLPTLRCLSALQVYGDWPANWMFEALKSCPTLAHVTVQFDDASVDFDESPFKGDLCALPSMKVFRLHGTYYPSTTSTAILRFLSMPSLTDLDINFNSDMYSVYLSDIEDLHMPHISEDVTQLALQSNNFVNLKTLRLTDMLISARGLNAIFGTLPSITHLTLNSITVYGTPVVENASLPQLQVLNVLDLPIQTVPDSLDSFLSFLQVRARSSRAPTAGDSAQIAVAPVRKARIVISSKHDGPTRQHKTSAQILQQMGVDFSLTFP